MNKVISPKKRPKPAQKVHVVVGEEKSSSKPKKFGIEIDEIFAGKKRKRLENEKYADTEKPAKVFAANTKSHEKMRIGKTRKNGAFKENSSTEFNSGMRKKTADGLTIYKEEELGFGKAEAGGTGLCPFDCDCCF